MSGSDLTLVGIAGLALQRHIKQFLLVIERYVGGGRQQVVIGRDVVLGVLIEENLLNDLVQHAPLAEVDQSANAVLVAVLNERQVLQVDTAADRYTQS